MTAKKKKRRRWVFLTVPLTIVALMGGLFLWVDQLCVNDANERLPFYPEATLVEETHNGIRMRGMGNSLVMLSTTDSEEDIAAWYEALAAELLSSGRVRGINSLSRWTEPAGERINIFYLSQCVL